MEISEYIWKKQKQILGKNNKVQNSVRMIDMSEEELKTAYNHCKQMLFNNEKTSLGRYLVLQEINKQIQYCNAELAVRWFLEELTKDNTISIPGNYLYVTSSNKIESPNGHVLFEKAQKTIYYRDVKTNKTYSKDVANLEFIKYFGRIYNLTSLYKEIYKDENIFNINNPTSTFM